MQIELAQKFRKSIAKSHSLQRKHTKAFCMLWFINLLPHCSFWVRTWAPAGPCVCEEVLPCRRAGWLSQMGVLWSWEDVQCHLHFSHQWDTWAGGGYIRLGSQEHSQFHILSDSTLSYCSYDSLVLAALDSTLTLLSLSLSSSLLPSGSIHVQW